MNGVRVITQNGRATNVMISIADFESTWDEIDRCREREELTPQSNNPNIRTIEH